MFTVQVVTETKPIFRTETAYETQTLKLFRGAEAFLTTLTNPVGLTTITDYEYHTRTVSPGIGALPSPVHHGTNNNRKVIDTSPVAPFGGGGIKPSLTVVTSTVTHNTVVPSVFMESYRIRFRNEFIYTTITSTTMVSTQLTSYVTKTQKVAPTVNHLLAAALAGALN